MTMTGETKDAILALVGHASELPADERKALIEDLLDHLCVCCGAELPKFGPCLVCGAARFSERP